MKMCADENDMFEKMAEEIKSQFENEKYETAAVLCFCEKEAEHVSKKLEDIMGENVNLAYMNKDTERFKKGVTVTTFYMAKGLEFDCVHIPYCDDRYKKNGFGKQGMYISETREMHELDMYTMK